MAQTIRQWLDRGTALLAQSGLDSPRFEAEVLMDSVTDRGRAWLYAHDDRELSGEEAARYWERIERRSRREPEAAIVGHKEFMGLDLTVTGDVLIPRPDTECVVEAALALLEGLEQPRVLDLCTGSGAIGVAMGAIRPDARMVFSDLSAPALAVARKNAGRFQVAGRFVQSDLLAAFGEGEVFDMIVSNPPYIPSLEIEGLEPDVRDYEPRLALDGGASGYAVYERLIPQAAAHLEDGGFLVMECGWNQGAQLARRLEAAAFNPLGEIYDLAGKSRGIAAKKGNI